jgi:hypothetical protein
MIPQNKLLHDIINDFIVEYTQGKENYLNVRKSAKNVFKLIKLILESKEYDILDHFELNSYDENIDYSLLENILYNENNEY